MLKKILLALLVILVIIQFIKPERNLSDDQTYNIGTQYAVPADVKQILKGACDDCHSNKTEYPWYANLQPVAWWLNNHIVDGKRHLNFSEFTNMPLAGQNHKLDEVVEMTEEKEMPISSYTALGMHKEADMTDAQRETIITWAKAQMNMLKEKYPADSLVMKKR